MTFQEKMIFTLKKTVYIYVNYTNLSKGRSFIMIAIHPTISNIIIDSIIPRIAIFVNFINKPLKIRKDIHLNIIYKFVKTIYFLIDIFKMITVLTTTITILFEPLL